LAFELRRSTGRTEFGKKLSIGGGVVLPLGGDIVFVIDGLYRAHGLTGSAINALIRLDVEHPVAFIDTVHGAFFNARLIFEIYTG